MENTDLDQEEEYDQYDINPDKVSFFFQNIFGQNWVVYRERPNLGWREL